MKKSAKLTKTGGVMNTNILTKIVTACLCMWSLGLAAEKTFVPVDQKSDQTVEQTNKIKPIGQEFSTQAELKADNDKEAAYYKGKKEATYRELNVLEDKEADYRDAKSMKAVKSIKNIKKAAYQKVL